MKTFREWHESVHNPLEDVRSVLVQISNEFPQANRGYWPFPQLLRKLKNAADISNYDLPAVEQMLQDPNNYLPVPDVPDASAANLNRLKQVIQSLSQAQQQTGSAFGGGDEEE